MADENANRDDNRVAVLLAVDDVDGEVRQLQVDSNGRLLVSAVIANQSFLDLTDTPSSYSGQGQKLVRVNSGETALEFVDVTGFATTALDNLSSVAINASLEVDTDNTYDLGAGVARWKDGYIVNTFTNTVSAGILAGNTLELRARDVDGAVWTTFITLTSNNNPTCDLAAGVTINGEAILNSADKTGSDAGIVSGTAGASGNLSQWNADGDLVDASIAVADVVTASSTDTFTNKTFDADGTGNSISNVDLANDMTGTLPIASGGTGQTTASAAFAALEQAATTTSTGTSELLTAAEVTTGTDTTRTMTADALAQSDYGKRVVGILVSDPQGDAITTGDLKAVFRTPSVMNGWNLVAVAASLTTVSSSGNPTMQIRNVTQAADMLSTALSIDANESDSSTAATPAVIDTNNDDVSTGDQIAIDIDTAGTGAKGLFVELIFQLP